MRIDSQKRKKLNMFSFNGPFKDLMLRIEYLMEEKSVIWMWFMTVKYYPDVRVLKCWLVASASQRKLSSGFLILHMAMRI